MTSTIAQLDTTDLAAQVAGPVLDPRNTRLRRRSPGLQCRPPTRRRPSSSAQPAPPTSPRRCAGHASRACRSAAQATGHGLTNELAGTVLISTRRLAHLEIDPATANGTGRRRRPVAGGDRRCRAARAGAAERLVVQCRRGRLHPRRRHRADGPPVRIRRRPRPLAHHGDGGRRDPLRRRRSPPRPVLGASRRQGRLRGGHRDRDRAGSGQPGSSVAGSSSPATSAADVLHAWRYVGADTAESRRPHLLRCCVFRRIRSCRRRCRDSSSCTCGMPTRRCRRGRSGCSPRCATTAPMLIDSDRRDALCRSRCGAHGPDIADARATTAGWPCRNSRPRPLTGWSPSTAPTPGPRWR